MIKIVGKNGTIHYINPAHIVHMIHYGEGSKRFPDPNNKLPHRLTAYEIRMSNGDVMFLNAEEYAEILKAKGVADVDEK